MKYLIIISFFIIALNNDLASNNFELSPLNFNLKRIAATDDIFVAYGSHGSALISSDGQKTWRQIKVFESGNIINLFIEENAMTAFSDIGDVNVSEDGGINLRKWMTGASVW